MLKGLVVCVALLAHAALAHAQDPAADRQAAPGSASSAVLEGDVYLQMQGGEVRRMAGRSVYLVPDSATASWAPACEARDSSRSRYLRLRRPARLAYEEARTARENRRAAHLARAESARAEAFAAAEPARRVEAEILAWLATHRATATGADGHYAFDAVAPGDYALYTEADLPYFWFAPVKVAPGRQTRELANRDVISVQFERAYMTASLVCSRANAILRPGPRKDPGYEEIDLNSESPPVLTNRSDVVRWLVRRYPRAIRGVGARVSVRFRIRADGTVDPESVEAMETSVAESVRGEVESAAEMVAEAMQFRPAMVDGRAVAVWVVLPVVFTEEPG